MSTLSLKTGLPVALTPTLNISLIAQNDLPDIIDMLGNPAVNEFLFFAPAPIDVYEGFFGPIIEETQNAIATGEWPEHLTIVIRDTSGTYMGMAGLPSVMFLEGNFELGYQLAEHAWGQGIATQAAQYLTALAFNELGAHKVTADCYASNAGSYKTLEKCGFNREGCQKDYYKVENGFDDLLHYGMTKADFLAQHTLR
ncbi:GNAT family N-acetyltransferase [Photobacterium kagoshimensis]|uniref:GNAT family N-acetyltransferase n=1 Tax=Photobacterium kagoshimensis TaxID=2910242 RepID=UPI003D1349C0